MSATSENEKRIAVQLEIKAMRTISKALETLDEPAKARVLAWVIQNYSDAAGQ